MKYEFHNCDNLEIQIPISECYKDCMTLVKSDIFRRIGKIPSVLSIYISMLKPFSDISFLFWLRFSSYKGILYPFCRFMYERTSRKKCIQISPFTKIGYGFYLGHEICIVINNKTIIGNNVNISQFLNIGTNHNAPAVIGDNVYIGPHVSIVENVHISSNSTIGAGTVVTKNVPKNATVAGVPSRILNFNNPARYIKFKYISEMEKSKI